MLVVTREGTASYRYFYLIKLNSLHVITAKLAVRTLHFFTVFSTKLLCNEKTAINTYSSGTFCIFPPVFLPVLPRYLQYC